MSQGILSDQAWEQLDTATQMLYDDITERGCTLLTIHYVAGPAQKIKGKYYPGLSLLVPKFTDATHYDLVIFREQMNQYMDKLIKETLPLDGEGGSD